MGLLFRLERGRHEVLLLNVQAVPERLTEFELLEAIEAEVGGLHGLGAKSARELAKAEFEIKVRAMRCQGRLVGGWAVVESNVNWQHVLLSCLGFVVLSRLQGP